jgi:hypothetical protein
MKLPPIPKWNNATDDIDSTDLLRRSRDYERSLLPPDIVVPRAGQIWEAVRDCDVHVRKWIIGPRVPVLWRDTRLSQGERVRISTLDDPKPLEIRFVPVRYAELHDSISPHSLRYDLWLKIARPWSVLPTVTCEPGYFSELFRLIKEVC